MKSIVIKISVLKDWINPYSTMQGVGGFIKPITLETDYIYVHAKLYEQRKRCLTFEVTVEDKDKKIFTKSKVINFIIE